MGYIGSGVQRFNTADGLTVTGSAEINSLTYPTADGSNGQVLKTNGSGTLSFGTVSSDLVNDTSPQLGGVLDTNGNNIEFPDSSGAEVNRLKFGAGDDLQIYHDGSDSYINDTGTGNLRLAGSSQVDIISSGGEFMAKFIADGAATLYHDNAAKISTTATGIDVQGQVIATKGSTGTLATFTDGVATNFTLKTDGSSVGTFGTEAGSTQLAFMVANSEKMRLDATGILLHGKTATNSDNAGFEVGTNGAIAATRASGHALLVNRLTDDGSAITIRRQGTTVGTIAVTSSGTTYNTTSDRRLKQDIEPLEATDKLMQMNPVSYSWKSDPDGPRSMGFIAQEMQEVMPEAVSTGDDDDAMMSMDYGRITPILVSALQDAHRKIEQLEQRLADMETGNE